MTPRNRAQKWGITVSVLALIVIGGFVLKGTELRANPWWLPKCAFHIWTGWHCPGCGNTRATLALLRGDLAGAVEQNVALIIALPFLILGAVRTWIRWVYPEHWKPLPFRWRWGYSLVLVGAVVLFMVLRNLPMKPWNWLAPVPLGETTAASPPGHARGDGLPGER